MCTARPQSTPCRSLGSWRHSKPRLAMARPNLPGCDGGNGGYGGGGKRRRACLVVLLLGAVAICYTGRSMTTRTDADLGTPHYAVESGLGFSENGNHRLRRLSIHHQPPPRRAHAMITLPMKLPSGVATATAGGFGRPHLSEVPTSSTDGVSQAKVSLTTINSPSHDSNSRPSTHPPTNPPTHPLTHARACMHLNSSRPRRRQSKRRTS